MSNVSLYFLNYGDELLAVRFSDWSPASGVEAGEGERDLVMDQAH
jgi:hypothetical protein